MNHLFGDLALFSADEIVKDKSDELAFLSETKGIIKLRSKMKHMHIVDKLNHVNSLKIVFESSFVVRECFSDGT